MRCWLMTALRPLTSGVCIRPCGQHAPAEPVGPARGVVDGAGPFRIVVASPCWPRRGTLERVGGNVNGCEALSRRAHTHVAVGPGKRCRSATFSGPSMNCSVQAADSFRSAAGNSDRNVASDARECGFRQTKMDRSPGAKPMLPAARRPDKHERCPKGLGATGAVRYRQKSPGRSRGLVATESAKACDQNVILQLLI